MNARADQEEDGGRLVMSLRYRRSTRRKLENLRDWWSIGSFRETIEMAIRKAWEEESRGRAT
jgi:hypothetical protein